MSKRKAVMLLVAGAVVMALASFGIVTAMQQGIEQYYGASSGVEQPVVAKGNYQEALQTLDSLEVKGRAPKTGYERSQFGDGWALVQGCSTRNIILHRDLTNPVLSGECKVLSGTLNDPYTGEVLQFSRDRSDEIQIDHVVALSDAWQKGAQQLTFEQRKAFANDPLELLAVDGRANQAKADADAASWLPKNKAFRCIYVERQVQVKKKYTLWVTEAEKQAIAAVLKGCATGV